MKNLTIFLAFVCVFLIASCGQGNKKYVDDKQVVDKLVDSACYGAAYKSDNAKMVLKNFESGMVGGTLEIDYAKTPHNIGTLSGKFSGDTLFVDFKFTSGTESVYTNPLAFLKKDGKLIMGVGQIETTMGRSYFVKDKPINFEVGKFVFEKENYK